MSDGVDAGGAATGLGGGNAGSSVGSGCSSGGGGESFRGKRIAISSGSGESLSDITS